MKQQSITDYLFDMQDREYKKFHSKLVPTLNPDIIIGVRTPKLRKLAKEIKDTELASQFIQDLPHKYYEENNLHAFLIEQISDYQQCITQIERFLPYVDNWATCDSMRPKVFKKNTDKLLSEIKKWIASSHTYTVRYGIEMLMVFFLDNQFDVAYLDMVASVKSEEYYINMMTAWYFATALAKQYESTLPYISRKLLPVWVHNKTIQKAVESFRISDEQKAFLKTLKVKE